MNPPRERSAIIAAWLEEGPTELPESTRRAIAVDVRTTHQSRRPAWAPRWFPRMDRQALVAVAAVAVVAVVIGAQAVSRYPSDGSNFGAPPPPVPSATSSPMPAATPPPVPASAAPSSSPSPSPTTLIIPPMQQTFFSERHGYTISYPAGWSSRPATQAWSPPDWKAGGSETDPFDFLEGGGEAPFLRAASALLPTGLSNAGDWIDEFLTFGDPDCVPPRERQEEITIDGAPGRLRDSCGEVEATVVLDGRVYMFTLFIWNDGVTNGRELFDALAATIDLRPEDAVLPSPSLPGRTT